jgi:hypothetical protein
VLYWPCNGDVGVGGDTQIGLQVSRVVTHAHMSRVNEPHVRASVILDTSVLNNPVRPFIAYDCLGPAQAARHQSCSRPTVLIVLIVLIASLSLSQHTGIMTNNVKCCVLEGRATCTMPVSSMSTTLH